MPLLATPRDRATLLILVLAAAIAVAVFPLFSGLLGAAALYVVFVHPYRRLAAVVGPRLGAGLTLLLALVAVALPVAWLVGLLVNQAPEAVRSVQSGALVAQAQRLRIGSIVIGPELVKAGEAVAAWLPAQLMRFAGSAASALLNLVIALFGLYFLLRSGDGAWRAARDYVPFSRETADQLLARFFGMTEAVLIGWVLVAVAQGAIVAAGFAIVALPDPIFWGTATAVASLVPLIGSSLVWAPAAVVLLVQGRLGATVLMLLTGAVASSVDNVIRLFVYRRVSNIHPMITLVGVVTGIRYFGLIGLLIGPLAIAYLFELLRFFRLEYGQAASQAGHQPQTGSL